MSKPAPLMRYHGGKWRLAPKIIEHFPPHSIYVEAFGGAAGVLCRKTPARTEIYNDLDAEIVNVFRVVREPELARQLANACRLTPYARTELELASGPAADPVEQARRTLFRAWASFGSAGATRTRSGFRTYSNADARYTPVVSAWNRVPEVIAWFTERLRTVIVECRPAVEVMAQHDSPVTLHYIDPPYLPETRSYDGGRYYRHDLDTEGHVVLLEALQSLRGMAVLSGYDSALYRERLNGWTQVQHGVNASGPRGGVSRTEVLWLNPTAANALSQADLFAGVAG